MKKPISRQEEKPRTGAEMLEHLIATGYVGMWADREETQDSVRFARKLRESVWQRENNIELDEKG